MFNEVYAESMSNQDKIKYLKQFQTLDKEIDRKIIEVSFWRSKLERVTAVYSDEPKGGGSISNKTEHLITKIVDLEAEIQKDISELIETRRDIEIVIKAVTDQQEQLLLSYRYIDGLSFERISCEMNYHWQWIHRLHKRALKKLEIKVCREV